jgi:hypothetical protein
VVADNQHGKVRGMVLRALERPMHRNKENAMSVSDRIQESMKRVKATTREALQSLDKALESAEKQNLRKVELRGGCPRVLETLARAGRGLIPPDQVEVAFAQALVQDVGNGVSEDLGYGRQADAEQISTQTIAVADRSTMSALRSAVSGGLRHAEV